MAAQREQGFYSTLVSVSPVDILPNFETKSQIKKKKSSCRTLAMANVASVVKERLSVGTTRNHLEVQSLTVGK